MKQGRQLWLVLLIIYWNLNFLRYHQIANELFQVIKKS